MNNISSITSLNQLQSRLFISSQYKQQCQHLGIILNAAIVVQILKDTQHHSYSLSDKTHFMKQILMLIEKYMLNIIVLSEQSEFVITLIRNIIINIKNLNDMRQNIKDQDNKNNHPISSNILNQKKQNHQNNTKQFNNNEQQQNNNKIKNQQQLNNNLIQKDKIFKHNNLNISQQQQERKKQFIKNRKLYIQILIEIFQIICKLCPINNRQLQTITTFLSDCHYQNTLSSDLFQNSYLMLQNAFKKHTITPFLYFNQPNQNYGIKVLLNNNKWMFNKGMTLWLWINISFVTECIILNLKTQDGKQLIIKYNQKSELIGEVTHGIGINIEIQNIDSNKFKQSIVIGLLPLSTTFLLGIQLFLEQGIMKSAFKLNIVMNSQLNYSIALNIPKFNSSQLITQFLLLHNFVGTLHSVIIQNKSELDKYTKIRQWSQSGPNSEELVWKLIASSLLKNDTIVAIYNSQRNCQALLLNYVSDKNHCCFNSKICNYKSKPINGQFLFDVHIGILYLLSKYYNHNLVVYIKEQKQNNLNNLLTKIILQLISICNQYQNKIGKDILFILYFIQLSQYSIKQSVLTYLQQLCKNTQNYYLNLIIKYLDLHMLMKQKLSIKYQYNIDVNPIHKIQLLFYLETTWIEKWNEIQSFKGWYSPSTFIMQINQPYNSQNYQFHQSQLALYQWSIRNFITNDYCKIMLEPIFKMPKLQYGQLYRTKSCMLEPFGVNLNHQFSRTKIISHKVKKSRFNRLREKVFGSNRKQSIIQKSKIPEKKQQIREQVRFECIKIELLSLVEGIVSVDSDGFITFTSKHVNQSFNHMCVKPFTNERLIYIAYHYNDVLFMRKRRFNQSNNCLQLRAKNGTMILLYFVTGKIDKFMAIFQGLIQNRKISYEYYMKSNCTLNWIDKKMSNYQYLQWLNEVSGRSYNDITQYPIMPWVYITNQPTQNKHQYRDFTKNMGSHGDQDRIFHFLHKFNSYNESQLFNQYHFGTHYSSSAIIINYMIRLQPFTSGSIALQSGKFDCADRIFYSYIGSWINATTSPTDIRQLIPEFYTIPEMFFNINNNNYGVTQTNDQIDNVQIPKWCSQGNPYEFVIGLRRQLESSAVSKQINHWIDLIYGYKQRGPLAIASMNIFFPLTYQNSIDLSKIDQLDSKLSYQTQIAHFGQNPCQIIEFNPHPQKTKITSVWEYKLITDGNQLTIQRCSIKKNNIKIDKTIFKSQFQSKHSVLNIKFIDEANFIVLQKYQYCLFHILENTDFISRQKQIDYQLQNCQVSLNYQQIQRQVPMVIVGPNLGLVGGFYFGYLQLLFINEPQFNQSEKMPMDTITAMDYSEQLKMLFLGDCLGRLQVYIITVQAKYVEFEECGSWIAHDSRINCINMNAKANMFVSCGRDGIINLYNAYSHELYHKFSSPNYSAVDVCCLSICPLYSVIFHSVSLSMTYSYSINGQYLSKLQDSSKGQLIGMKSMCSSINIDSMIYVNAVRQLCIYETPILKIKRKIKLRKDEYQITSVQIGKKMCIVANQNGDIFIVSTPKT